jgi:hypothetical protein
MNFSTGDSVKRSRSRPGSSLEGICGPAAVASEIPAARNSPLTPGKLVMAELRPVEIAGQPTPETVRVLSDLFESESTLDFLSGRIF